MMARRIEAPVEVKPARLDLRDALPDRYWRGRADFEVWGGDLHRHVPREYWHEFDRRWIYRISADGTWAVSCPATTTSTSLPQYADEKEPVMTKQPIAGDVAARRQKERVR